MPRQQATALFQTPVSRRPFRSTRPKDAATVEDKRNIVIAMLLAALILFGWPTLTARFFPAANPPATRVVDGRQVAVPAPGQVPPAARPAAARQIGAALGESARLPIETPTLRGSVNLTGARIDDLVLVRYRQTVDKNAPPVRLFAPGGTAGAYFAGLGWSGAGAPTASTVWQAPAGARLTPATPVTLTWANGQGQTFAITLAVDASYMFTATQRVVNAGTAPVALAPYAYLNRVGVSPDPSSYTIHAGLMGVFNGAARYIDTDDVTEAPGGTLATRTTGGWIGFTDKYWLGAIIPDARTPVDTSIRASAGNIFQADFADAERLLAAGQARSTTTRIFAGAKETSILDGYTDAGVTLLDRATDWGWFIWFAKPIFYLLDWLFKHLGNFGVAIMALTLIIRLAMYPIAQKQFTSMAQMRVLQPKLKALQTRYADDKPKLQTEMMALYKTEKVNPLAGCLPMVIQIPIFYSLYKSLMLTVEMRHQPFVGWIRDLSAPDPAHILNLFGLLDFTPPAFLGIGVLAVLLGVSMFAQFKLNPPPTDPVQAQVFSIMPWMLMFVMAPFAAGLLLYWITNNVLAIAQQRLLYARYPAMRAAMAAT